MGTEDIRKLISDAAKKATDSGGRTAVAMVSKYVYWILTGALGILVTVCGYFLAKTGDLLQDTVRRVEQHEKEQEAVRGRMKVLEDAPKPDLIEQALLKREQQVFKDDLKDLKLDMKDIKSDVKQISNSVQLLEANSRRRNPENIP